MLFVKKLDPRAIAPTCSHPGEDLGYDLYALESVVVKAGYVTKVRTGIAAEHSHVESQSEFGYTHTSDGLLIRDRSSMAANNLFVMGGVIDAGYRGEIIVMFNRFEFRPYQINAGDKIAQMIPIPVLTGEGVMQIEAFTEEITMRGTNGFGSTGR